MRLSYLDSRSCCLPNLHPACIGLQQQNQQRTPQSVQPDWTELQSDTPSTRNCQLCWDRPNITGTYEAQELYWWESTPTATGCFWLCDSSATIGASRGTDVDMTGIGFDANRSNPIFGKSTTVQPLALTLLPCIKF